MKTSIRRLGNSQGVIIPKPLLAQIGMKTDDIVELTVRNGKITIEPVPVHPRDGWAEDAKAIRAAGDDKLVWPDFANHADKDWKW